MPPVDLFFFLVRTFNHLKAGIVVVVVVVWCVEASELKGKRRRLETVDCLASLVEAAKLGKG